MICALTNMLLLVVNRLTLYFYSSFFIALNCTTLFTYCIALKSPFVFYLFYCSELFFYGLFDKVLLPSSLQPKLVVCLSFDGFCCKVFPKELQGCWSCAERKLLLHITRGNSSALPALRFWPRTSVGE